MLKRGFTLIEIIVSTLILAIILTGFFSIFFAGRRHIRHSSRRMTAIELSGYYLNPLSTDVRQAYPPPAWTSNCVGTNTGCPSGTEAISGITYTYSCNSDVGPIANLRRLTCTVTWNEADF